MIRAFLPFLFTSLMLVSCASTSEVTSRPFESAFTQTPELTLAITPVIASSPTLLAKSTLTPYPVNPTARAFQERFKDLPPGMVGSLVLSTSPDSSWSAEMTLIEPTSITLGDRYYIQLEVTRIDHEITWQVIDGWKVVDEWTAGVLQMIVPSEFTWSTDGRSFYFTNEPKFFQSDPTDDKMCHVFANGLDLHRVDLTTGKVVAILSNIAWQVSLSPKEDKLAYVPADQNDLVVRDLSTGEEVQVMHDTDKPFRVRRILWSPDGERILLTLAIEPCSSKRRFWAESSSIVRVDLATLTTTTLINEDTSMLEAIHWEEGEFPIVQNNIGKMWWLDPISGELTERAD
jgi:hypothetical protein